MGRHSGAVCTACQELIPVRDGRLVEHQHQFPTLGKSMPCVGSHGVAPDDAALLGAQGSSGDIGLDRHPALGRPQETVSR